MSRETRGVLLLGGTGFIGYHATLELVRRGHRVTVLALPPAPADGVLPAGVETVTADLAALSDVQLSGLMRGRPAVVFAAGLDDRVTPRRPAYPAFRRANVEAAVRFFSAACRAGVGRGVLLGSYFAHFARVWPGLELARHHPYIRSRVEQEEACREASLPDLALSVLELPYIFGAAPGRVPLWRPLVTYVRTAPLLLYPRGGTNMVAVAHVAEAIAGAVERGRAGATYLVGDENLTWVEFLGRLSAAAGRRRRVVTVPDWLVRPGLGLVGLGHRLTGREGGLDPARLLKLQAAETFFDPEPARRELGFGSGGLDRALADTVAACRGRG